MRSLKKAFKLVCWTLLIILASFGIGLSGGVAIPSVRRKEDTPFTIEMVEFEKETSELNSEEEDKT
ncbi:hypothetical protein [Pedobacter gandavensis]|uniref:hypothetical protein n=1 Tax=Pedobacter gandavensis TaxID=2679963 RepID=UPI00292F23E8|nr:hypothetical protein [Pedobacter gandavensis]